MHSLTTDSGFDHARLQEHQRLNHFPRHVELTRKHALAGPLHAVSSSEVLTALSSTLPTIRANFCAMT